MKDSKRKYTGVLQYFHNYEHDPEGRTHCVGAESNPYIIIHRDGMHVINCQYARGHGEGNKPQWFKFIKHVKNGYDMSFYENIDAQDVPEKGKKPTTDVEEFEEAYDEAMTKKRKLGH